MSFENVERLTEEELYRLLKHPDWCSPKVAMDITGYQERAFYKALCQKVKGVFLIRHKVADVYGRPKMKFIHKPSLISFMKNDSIRLKKEADKWKKHYEIQIRNLPILERMYPNA